MNKYILIGIGAIVLIGGGLYVALSSTPDSDSTATDSVAVTNNVVPTATPAPISDRMMMDDAKDTAKPADEPVAMQGYSGEVLAGDVSPYIAFNQADYEKAISEGKLVVLDFYASWCPTCRGEAPDTYKAFEMLNNPDVVGFRVNFKDDDTDEYEAMLSKDNKVRTQHIKLFMLNGVEVHRVAGVFDTEEFLEEINGVL